MSISRDLGYDHGWSWPWQAAAVQWQAVAVQWQVATGRISIITTANHLDLPTSTHQIQLTTEHQSESPNQLTNRCGLHCLGSITHCLAVAVDPDRLLGLGH